MSDITTLTGVVATVPVHRVTSNGLAITSFRLASAHRRFDKEKKGWVDGETNWYTVSTFRHLAFNTARSVRKGEHILVTGRLHVRNWAKDERKGTNIEVEADAIGHDLFWCTTVFARSAPQPAQQPFSDRYGAELSAADPAGFDAIAAGAPLPAAADWMANPDRGSAEWSTSDAGVDAGADAGADAGVDADTGEVLEQGEPVDPDLDDPYESSADGFLPASEAGMATIDS